ncbi:MAG: hypothetical protein AB7V48_15150 [Sedimentibacter sp.]
MKIGIKYCGGCNPSFDRIRFVKLLKKEFADMAFETADKDVNYYLLIVICGCMRACANTIDYKYREILYITKETDFARAKGIILELYAN